MGSAVEKKNQQRHSCRLAGTHQPTEKSGNMGQIMKKIPERERERERERTMASCWSKPELEAVR